MDPVPPDSPDPVAPPNRPGPASDRPDPASERPDPGVVLPGRPDPAAPEERALAAGVAGRLEPLVRLLRSLSPQNGLSLTAAATLGTLERSGPHRLTSLAAREGVTQPAMTQLIARLEQARLVRRAPDPADGRVVEVHISGEGTALLARRRAVRAERLAGILADLSLQQRAALAAALPAIDALVGAGNGISVPDARPATQLRVEGTARGTTPPEDATAPPAPLEARAPQPPPGNGAS